jgi:hypothetical protein
VRGCEGDKTFSIIFEIFWFLLNPQYVGLNVGFLIQILASFESYVGHINVICLVVEYDVKEVIPLLMTIFEQLNPTIQA